MKKFWIIGHPLSFCLSTPVMNGALKEAGIEAEFETHDIEPEAFPQVMEKVRSGELAGIVATMPYKTPSVAFVDEASEEIGVINAVNFVWNREGRLHGYDTDWLGAMGALHEVIPSVEGKRILILGAGGAARGAAYGLKKEGALVTIWNRTPERAKAFAEKIGVDYIENLESLRDEPDIIINATSSSSLDRQSTMVPFYLWKTVEVAMDAVYGKTSLFLEEAKAAGVRSTVSGERWFLNQVFPLFEILTGQKAPIPLMTRLTTEAQDIQKL
ncbi:MAG: Gfo/Idh/MocA family oxidoreductase [Candidatus Gracilibacteria bacterium]